MGCLSALCFGMGPSPDVGPDPENNPFFDPMAEEFESEYNYKEKFTVHDGDKIVKTLDRSDYPPGRQGYEQFHEDVKRIEERQRAEVLARQTKELAELEREAIGILEEAASDLERKKLLEEREAAEKNRSSRFSFKWFVSLIIFLGMSVFGFNLKKKISPLFYGICFIVLLFFIIFPKLLYGSTILVIILFVLKKKFAKEPDPFPEEEA